MLVVDLMFSLPVGSFAVCALSIVLSCFFRVVMSARYSVSLLSFCFVLSRIMRVCSIVSYVLFFVFVSCVRVVFISYCVVMSYCILCS